MSHLDLGWLFSRDLTWYDLLANLPDRDLSRCFSNFEALLDATVGRARNHVKISGRSWDLIYHKDEITMC
jgi:hypothetical protein